MKTSEETIADNDIAGTDIRIMPDLLYLRKVCRNLARTQSILELGAGALSESKLLLARIDLPQFKELPHQNTTKAQL